MWLDPPRCDARRGGTRSSWTPPEGGLRRDPQPRDPRPKTLMPTIVVNGKERQIEEGLSIEGLLAQLELDPRAVAVEHERRIVKRDAFGEIELADGDRLEIVHFVQGG